MPNRGEVGGLREDGKDRRAVALPTTQWSLVLAASEPSSRDGAEALEALCRAYYYPLYAFVRRQGHDPEDAKDLIQEFFSRVCHKNYLGEAREERGRFRTFLLACLKHFLANEWNREQALKRGGGLRFVSLDGDNSEHRYAIEPVDSLTPAQLFDRVWAGTVLERVKLRMRRSYAGRGEEERFALLEGCLLGEGAPSGYEGIAVKLGTTEVSVRSEVQRLRRKFRQWLRQEILETVTTIEEVNEELRMLIAALRDSVR